jgi:hypothetical protein
VFVAGLWPLTVGVAGWVIFTSSLDLRFRFTDTLSRGNEPAGPSDS